MYYIYNADRLMTGRGYRNLFIYIFAVLRIGLRCSEWRCSQQNNRGWQCDALHKLFESNHATQHQYSIHLHVMAGRVCRYTKGPMLSLCLTNLCLISTPTAPVDTKGTPLPSPKSEATKNIYFKITLEHSANALGAKMKGTLAEAPSEKPD
jgi:hypothetical protein